MRALRLIACIVALLAGAAALHVSASDRVALLIGNNQYGTAPLRNAVNDANDLAAVLKELGFKVIVRENATRRDMYDAIREFGASLDGASTAFFFYAGHAMQFRDRNYLIPIDIAMGSEEDVTFFAVELQQVFDRIEKARTRHNFMVLDACRDNPFASSFKVSSAGLAQMSAPSGTLIAYATSPGSTAADGFGRNGVYTKHILQQIRVPDMPAEIMFKRVREGVEQETIRRQTPWDSSSLKGDFAFNSTASRPASASASAPAAPSADLALTVELQFWLSVKDSSRPEEVRAYLDRYPKGTFAPLARSRLESMTRPTQVAAAEAPTMRAAPAPAQAAQPVPSATPVPPASAPEKPVQLASAPPTAPPSAPARLDPLPGKEIAPGIREIVFADGSVYRGAVKGALLHGKGEYVAKSFRYQGDFADGVKHGQGIYTWENGNRYEGPFVEDRPEGIGKYAFANGDAYQGELRSGALTGRGIYVAKSGDTQEGTFVDAKLHGVGTYRFASGDRYEGEVSQGRLHGKGRYYIKGGDRIEGTFVDGKAQGKGTYYFTNGDRYEGEMDGSELTGKGVYFYAAGLKYEGEVRRGQPQGKGVFWFVDGTRFEGVFEGLARAKGELLRPDGTKVEAEMVDGAVRVF